MSVNHTGQLMVNFDSDDPESILFEFCFLDAPRNCRTFDIFISVDNLDDTDFLIQDYLSDGGENYVFHAPKLA